MVFEAEWRDAWRRGAAALSRFVLISAADAVVNGVRERRSNRWYSPRARRDPVMTTFLADVKYGLRLLLRNPRLAILAVGTLALGMGLSVSLYSVAHGTLVRPLPFRDEARVVMMYEFAPRNGIKGNVAPANFLDWRARSHAFSHMGLLRPFSTTVTSPGSDPVRADGRRVHGDAFAALGLDPLLGRVFTADDERPGAKVVVLSYRLWQQVFGGDRSIVGRSIALDEAPFTVVGVLKPVLRVPGGPIGFDEIFVPWILPPQLRQARMSHISEAVARIRNGVTHEQAQADIATVAEALSREYPQSNKDETVLLVPVREALTGDVKPALVMLVGAVTLVLLMACVNFANLLLARATGRRQEMLVRAALGAGRTRLLRQLFAESLTLGVIAGFAGLLLAYWFAASLGAMLPSELAVAVDTHVDRRVAFAALGVCIATAVAFGLAPAWFILRSGTGHVVRDGRGTVAHSAHARHVLVVVQVALAVVMLAGAGLLLRSFVRLTGVKPGFHADRVLTLSVELPRTRYRGPDEWEPFFNRLIAELGSLPGVEAAAGVSGLPLNENGGSVGFHAEGQPVPRDNEHSYVIYRLVTPGYFNTIGIPLIDGRDFTAADRPASARVVIVNQTFASRYWPGERAVGKRVAFTSQPTADDWTTVVGVVGDTHHWSLAEAVDVQLYVPYTQEPNWYPPGQIALRTSVDPVSVAAAARERIRAIDPQIPVSDIRTMNEIVSKSVAAPRFNLTLLGMLSISALVLASVGIYGLLAFSVALRTREIGVRSALGASRAAISTMILRDGLRLTVVGIVAGLAVAVAAVRWVKTLLFQVEPYDPVTFAGIAFLFLIIALVACYVPARRAARVDPIVALRSD